MNVYEKLMQARCNFHKLPLKKSGHNKFAGYKYFELGDFLVPALEIFKNHRLCSTISFEDQDAVMVIVNIDEPTEQIMLRSPMGSASLKGCNEVQNIGAVETFQRRYLWMIALEIVEHDAIEPVTDPSEENENTVNKEKPPKRVKLNGPYTYKTALWSAARRLVSDINGCGDSSMLEGLLMDNETKALLDQCERDAPKLLYGGEGLPEDYEPISNLIARFRSDFENIENNTVNAR